MSSSCIIYDVAHYLVLGVRVRLQAYEEAPGQAAQHKLPHPPRGPVSYRVTRTTRVQTHVQLDRSLQVRVFDEISFRENFAKLATKRFSCFAKIRHEFREFRNFAKLPRLRKKRVSRNTKHENRENEENWKKKYKILLFF